MQQRERVNTIPVAAIDNVTPAFFNFSSAFIPFLMAFDSDSGGSGASAYPPAPLRLASAEFGRVFEKESLQFFSPWSQVEPASSLRVYSLTAVKAPLGLTERLQHRWRQEGEFVCASPFHYLRDEGFRLWTSCVFSSVPPGAILRVDLETGGG